MFIHHYKGVTLLELLIVVSLILFLTFIAFPFMYSWLQSNQLEVTAKDIMAHLRKVQKKAMVGIDNMPWGVNIETKAYILFQGSDFSTRDSSYDEIYQTPESIRLSNTFTNIIFFNNKGEALQEGVIVVSDLYGNNIAIDIRDTGVIDFL